MDSNSILISILCWSLPGKWVPLGRMVEGGSKHSDLFISIQWPLLLILMISASIIDDNVLSDGLVFLREAWDAFTPQEPTYICKSSIQNLKLTPRRLVHSNSLLLKLLIGPHPLPYTTTTLHNINIII